MSNCGVRPGVWRGQGTQATAPAGVGGQGERGLLAGFAGKGRVACALCQRVTQAAVKLWSAV